MALFNVFEKAGRGFPDEKVKGGVTEAEALRYLDDKRRDWDAAGIIRYDFINSIYANNCAHVFVHEIETVSEGEAALASVASETTENKQENAA